MEERGRAGRTEDAKGNMKTRLMRRNEAEQGGWMKGKGEGRWKRERGRRLRRKADIRNTHPYTKIKGDNIIFQTP